MRRLSQERVPVPPSTEGLFVLTNIINVEKYKVLFSKPFTHLQTKKQNLPFAVGNLLSNLSPSI